MGVDREPKAARRARRLASRRGSTFTAFVLVFSAVLLASAGLYVSTTRSLSAYAAHQATASRLREAAFGGVRWAREAAARSGTRGRGAFSLDGIEVEVRYAPRPSPGAGDLPLAVRSVAREGSVALRVDAVLRARAGRFVLEDFRIAHGP